MVAQLKLENDTLEKFLETLKGKQPIPNGANTKMKKNKSATQKFLNKFGV